MNENIVIEVKDVEKNFKVYLDRGNTLKEKLITRGRGEFDKRHVLRGISFSVSKGEAIGLIGKNGCGKSTTLKLLTKIIYPDAGQIYIKGKVSSLLELGAGFHPDMSGRENIYLNASIFGLTKKQIDQKVDEIIQFSELEEFIDNPVRTYSSGMYMRLAFSVAINVDADILLIDEILAVGDISFQKKCFEKLKEIKRKGTNIVIVSHSLSQIEEICDKSIWIEEGLIKEIGNPVDVHRAYLASMEEKRLDRFEEESLNEKKEEKKIESFTEENEDIPEILRPIQRLSHQNKNLLFAEDKLNRNGNGKLKYTRLNLFNEEMKPKVVFELNDKILVYLEYAAETKEEAVTYSFEIVNENGICVYATNSFLQEQKVYQNKKNGCLFIELEDVRLLPGAYFICLGAHDKNAVILDAVCAAKIEMKDSSNRGDSGIYRIETKWNIN